MDHSSLVRPAMLGAMVRALMRRHHVTIRDLSARMGITQKRIRHCRRAGVESLLAAVDWIEAITGQRWDRAQEIHNPASVRDWIRAVITR